MPLAETGERTLQPDLFDRPRRTPGRQRERIAVGRFSELVPEGDVVAASQPAPG